MSKVIKGDLTGGSIKSMCDALNSDVSDADSLIGSIEDFVSSTEKSLVGPSYDLARSRLTSYIDILNKRKQVAKDLSSAISSAASQLAAFMGEYSELDTSKIAEYESNVEELKNQISEAQAHNSNLKKGETPIDLSGFQASLKEFEKILAKLRELDSQDASCFSQVSAFSGSIGEIGSFSCVSV